MTWKDLENEWQKTTVRDHEVYRRPVDDRWVVKVEKGRVTISTRTSSENMHRNIDHIIDLAGG